MADEIEWGEIYDDDYVMPFEPGIECKLGCKLLLRFGLPCKHWLYKAYWDDVLIPFSLFHPRWLLDSPAILRERWVMS